MRIPEKLSIGGIDYTIYWNDGKIRYVNEKGEDCVYDSLANIDFIENEINISDELSKQTSVLSFLHEIVHGIMFSMGVQCDQEIVNDERFTEGFANLLMQVMKQLCDMELENPPERVEEEMTILNIDVEDMYVGNVPDDSE